MAGTGKSTRSFKPAWLVAALAALGPSAASASEPVCPDGNLLAAAEPRSAVGVSAAERITDGELSIEGAAWASALSSVIASDRSEILFDLGRRLPVRKILIQADNDDLYALEVSLDGESFEPLWVADPDPRSGLRLRAVEGLDASGRFLRLTAQAGDGRYSVAELQVFCRAPASWPPVLERRRPEPVLTPRRIDARRKILLAALAALAFAALALARRRAPEEGRSTGGLAGVVTLVAATAALAAAANAALGAWGLLFAFELGGSWGLYLLALARRRHHPGRWPAVILVLLAAEALYAWRVGVAAGFSIVVALVAALSAVAVAAWRRPPVWRALLEPIACGLLIVAGALAWTNFGRFHGSRALHYWEMFHYYVGAEYFPELRYTRLYLCAAVAERESFPDLDYAGRKIRDLGDNRLVPLAPELERAEECRAAFSPARWRAFRADVLELRHLMGGGWFGDSLADHGYNATPVWTLFGRLLIDRVGDRGERPLDERLRRLAWIDPLLFAGAFALVLWAFGPRAAALAVVLWGTGLPWDYTFTGGALGRAPWFFAAAAGVCLLKKSRPALAGAGLALSAALRVFPAVLLAGVALRMAWDLAEKRRPTPAHRRIVAGSGLALLVLLAFGAIGGGGLRVYGEFWANSVKHRDTRLTNHMGLPTLFSYDAAKVGRLTVDDSLDDPWAVWKEGRGRTLRRRWLAYAATVAGLFALLGLLVRRFEEWEAATFGSLLAFALLELTSYYYVFLILLAPIAVRRLGPTFATIGVAAASQWLFLRIGWYDELYTAQSALLFGGILWVLADRGLRGAGTRR